jgi:uncharacterized membrane protein
MTNEERDQRETPPESQRDADGLDETHNLNVGVGGAVGVAGGGAAGAAMGAVLGGPIGALVGGLGGAVAGGVLGAAVTQGVSPVEPGENPNAIPALPEETAPPEPKRQGDAAP